MDSQIIISQIRNFILLLLTVTIFSCEDNKQPELNIDELSVDFTDGLDDNEREIIGKAKELIIDACDITDGKYDFSNVKREELGISEELFKYIKVNYGYFNLKIDQGFYKLQGKKLLSTKVGNGLKSLAKNDHMFAIIESDRDCPDDRYTQYSGGQFMYEVFEEATDWYKVYEKDGYNIYEYTNTTYRYTYKRVWVENPYVYNVNANNLVYYAGTRSGGGSRLRSKGYPIPSPYDVPDVIVDTVFTHSDAGCLMEALEAGGNESILNKLLEGFRLDSSNIDVVYVLKDKVINTNTNKEVNGHCLQSLKSDGSVKLTIEISKNRMDKRSFLETACTILHETFHAHLFGMVDKKSELYNSFGEINFKKTWDEYLNKYGKDAQHNIMADRYIEYMKEGLKVLYNNWNETERKDFESKVYGIAIDYENNEMYQNNTDWLFTCLAWSGLIGKTDAGKKFYEENKKRYRTTRNLIFTKIRKDCPFKNK